MTTPRWVRRLVERHNQLVEKKFLKSLTPEAALEHASVKATLDAWLDAEEAGRLEHLRVVLHALQAKEAGHAPQS